MSLLSRVPGWLVTFLDGFVTFLMAALLLEVLLLIVGRQVGWSWVWLYDVTRWTLAWLVFIGAVPLAARGAHLAIDIASHALPGWLRRSSAALTALATAAVAGLIAYYGGAETHHMYEVDERSMSGTLPAFLGYGVLPVAFTLLAIAALASLAKTHSTEKK
jgi:TRAP-type C4-dicarboxylate transport system permease small subunit